MRAIITLVAVVVLASLSFTSPRVTSQTGTSPQTPNPTQANALENEFLRLEQAWMDAAIKRYGRTLERIMANEFVMTISVLPGERVTKTEFIAESVRLGNRIDSFTYDNLVVQAVGDVVVVNALCNVKALRRGVDLSGDYFVTDVWVKRGADWQVVGRNMARARTNSPRSGDNAGNNQGGNARGNRRGNQPRRVDPCTQDCRTKYAEDSKRCLIKTQTDDGEVFSYDGACMRVLNEALGICSAECRKQSGAARPSPTP